MPPPRRRRGCLGPLILGLAALLAVAFVVAFVVVPRVVAERVAEASAKRGVDLAYAGTRIGLSSVSLTEASAHPRGTERVRLTAPRLEADLDWLRPYFIRIPEAAVVMSGDYEEVLSSLRGVRAADARLAADERLPVDVLAGTLGWDAPLGASTRVDFGQLALSYRPKGVKEGVLRIALGGGAFRRGKLRIEPLRVSISRKNAGGAESSQLEASFGGGEGVNGKDENGARGGKLALSRDPDGDAAALELHALALLPLLPGGIRALDLSRTTLEGTASYDFSTDGDARSRGKLALMHVALPSLHLGPLDVTLSGDARASWSAKPKKGAPGVMTLDDAHVDVDVAGGTRRVAVTGQVSVGTKGEGPFTVDLAWSLAAVECAELAAAATAGFGGGLVTGTLTAHGTIRGDLADPASLRVTTEVDPGCRVPTGGAFGGILGGLGQ